MKKTAAAILLTILFAMSCSNGEQRQHPSSSEITDSSTIIIKGVQKVTAYYNATGFIIKQTTHSWNNEYHYWAFAHSHQNSYNGRGQLITKETAMPDVFDQKKITSLERDSFEYTPQGDTAVSTKYIYSSSTDKWTRVSKSEFDYQSHQKTSETTFSWDIINQQWHTVFNRFFEYDSAGRLVSYRTIVPDRNDTASKNTTLCKIQYDENGFEASRIETSL